MITYYQLWNLSIRLVGTVVDVGVFFRLLMSAINTGHMSTYDYDQEVGMQDVNSIVLTFSPFWSTIPQDSIDSYKYHQVRCRLFYQRCHQMLGHGSDEKQLSRISRISPILLEFLLRCFNCLSYCVRVVCKGVTLNLLPL